MNSGSKFKLGKAGVNSDIIYLSANFLQEVISGKYLPQFTNTTENQSLACMLYGYF